MHNRRATALLIAAATVAASLTLVAGSSAASPRSALGGVIHYYETGAGSSGTDAAVVTGAFTDHGVDRLGAADSGNVNRIVLSKGSLEVNVARLDKKIAPTAYDSTSCSLALSGKGTAPLSHGTGAYRGISGAVTVVVNEVEILPKLKSGTCNESQDATPVALLVWVTGSGAVSFE